MLEQRQPSPSQSLARHCSYQKHSSSSKSSTETKTSKHKPEKEKEKKMLQRKTRHRERERERERASAYIENGVATEAESATEIVVPYYQDHKNKDSQHMDNR
jgi:hypothetical protein